jgi:O-antigen/teichoic acid export membrane protein
MTAATPRSNPFARRVAAVFGAKIVVFALGLTTTIVVSRVLGPSGKGAYVAVTSLPAMLGAVGVFGIPGAINYYSARGASVGGLLKSAIVFVAVIASVSIAVLWFALPLLERSILSAAPDDMLRLILIAIPTGMVASFAGTILYGRHEVKTYTSIMVGQAIVTPIVLILLVGVFRFGVPGAVAGSVAISTGGALAVLVAVRHVAIHHPEGDTASTRSLLSYGLRVYPAGISGYFNYRADTFIIQALMISSAGPLGLYSIAVTMAELLFYIPDSVTTIFLPTIAGATPEEADEKLGRVSRLTMLVTVSGALVLIPVAWLGLHLVLPPYVDSMPPFLVLLPAVVSLSLSKVLTSYLAGRGRLGPLSTGAVITLVLNLVANVLLIPRFGIVGAAGASLISYTAMALMMLAVTSRVSHQSPLGLIVPGREEIRVIRRVAARGLVGAMARVRR